MKEINYISKNDTRVVNYDFTGLFVCKVNLWTVASRCFGKSKLDKLGMHVKCNTNSASFKISVEFNLKEEKILNSLDANEILMRMYQLLFSSSALLVKLVEIFMLLGFY